MRGPFALWLIPLVVSLPLQASAEEPPLRLSLQEAIRLTLRHNLDLRMEERGLRARETEVTSQEAKFDPELSLALSESRTKRFATSQVFASEQDTQLYATGLKQRLHTGGAYELQLNTRRLETIGPVLFQVLNPSYSTDLTLTLTHPLLRGAGRRAAGSEIVIATHNARVSREALEAQISGLVAQVATLYWDLVYQIEHAAVQRQLRASAQRLVELTRARAEQGLLAPHEVLVAEAGLASREEKVLLAEKAVKDTEDQLRRLLNLPVQPLTEDVTILPTDEPAVRAEPVDLEAAITAALSHRPEVRQARAELDSRATALAAARNQLLPGLDLKGSVGLNGLGETPGDNLDRLRSGNFTLWEAGLTLSLPLGNRPSKSLVSRRRFEIEQVEFDLAGRKQAVVVEVKEAARRVTTDAKRVEVTRRARELAEKRLEVETERFSLGLTSIQETLRAQDELAEAQSSEARAMTDAHKSLVALAKSEGRLLEASGVRMEDGP